MELASNVHRTVWAFQALVNNWLGVSSLAKSLAHLVVCSRLNQWNTTYMLKVSVVMLKYPSMVFRKSEQGLEWDTENILCFLDTTVFTAAIGQLFGYLSYPINILSCLWRIHIFSAGDLKAIECSLKATCNHRGLFLLEHQSCSDLSFYSGLLHPISVKLHRELDPLTSLKQKGLSFLRSKISQNLLLHFSLAFCRVSCMQL